jgi:hypothetical protein
MALRAALLAAVLLVPCIASAQAWLPSKGTFSTAFVISDVLNTQHWLPDGSLSGENGKPDPGHTRSTTYAFLASYGLTDRVMLSGSLPYVETRFWGPPSHGGAPDFNADDGGTHGFLTDLRVNVHYQLLREPFALAPFIGYVIPTNNNYFVKGHAAQGRGLDELLIGFGAAKPRRMDPADVRADEHVRLRRKVADVKHDRSNASLEIGTFVTPRWNIAAYGWWQWTHGGQYRCRQVIPCSHITTASQPTNLQCRPRTGWAFTPTVTAFATYSEGVSGKNGHRVNQGVTFGVSYGFRPRAEAVGVAKQ